MASTPSLVLHARMRTPRNNDDPQLTRCLVEQRAFVDDPMFVLDIGASGGIDSYWDEFGDQLEVVGFDPLVREVARLNGDPRQGTPYVAAWVTSTSSTREDDVASTEFFRRTSAFRAAEVASLDYARNYFNAGAPIELATDQVVLDEFLLKQSF